MEPTAGHETYKRVQFDGAVTERPAGALPSHFRYTAMTLLLIIIVLIVLFGGGGGYYGYNRGYYGNNGLGCFGIIIIILILFALFGHHSHYY
jgi:hypothetical protein